MQFTFPHTIENSIGEKLTFLELKKEAEGDRLIVENYVQPGVGPLMHIHWLQDEALTVVNGNLAYQVLGEPVQYAKEGETVVFKRGTPHRFWNHGKDILHCTGWVFPANNLVYFLTSIYNAQNKSGKAQPERFDGAYLMTRYKSEFDLPEIPKFVKKSIIPFTYFIGKVFGKYGHFRNAPAPLKG